MAMHSQICKVWCAVCGNNITTVDAMFDANFNMGKARVVAHINDVDSLRSQGKVEQRVVMTRENNFAWERVNA